MRDGGGLPRALEFEYLVAPSGRMAGQRCLSRKLYAISGRAGIYRRMPRSTSALKSIRPGAFLAFFDGTIVELLRDRDAERELCAVGFAARGDTDLHPLHQPPTPGAAAADADQLRQVGLAVSEAINRNQAHGDLPTAEDMSRGGLKTPVHYEPQARRVQREPAEDLAGGTDHGPPEEGKTAAEILEEQGRGYIPMQ